MIHRSLKSLLVCTLLAVGLTSCTTPSAPLFDQLAEGTTERNYLSTSSTTPPPSEGGSQLGQPPSINAEAFIVIDPRTGTVLLEKNAHQKRHVASTQKLLSALVLLDGSLDKTIQVVDSDTWVEPTKMGIQAGERYAKRDLLEAMLVRSSNDIARCLARSHAGSEQGFATLMNRKASELGMRNSHFVNASGLTAAGQYSTAFDIAIAATHAMNNSFISNTVQTKELTFKFADGRTKVIYNTNKCLRMTPYCVGMKTGYTDPAGRCLVSCGKNGFRRVLVVVLGSKVPDIWTDSVELMHWGLNLPQPTFADASS